MPLPSLPQLQLPRRRAMPAEHSRPPHAVVWAEHMGNWTAWSEVIESVYITSGGEDTGAEESDALCSSLYYEGGDDEVDLATAYALVEDGTIGDDTLVYSDEMNFPFEGWTVCPPLAAEMALQLHMLTGHVLWSPPPSPPGMEQLQLPLWRGRGTVRGLYLAVDRGRRGGARYCGADGRADGRQHLR